MQKIVVCFLLAGILFCGASCSPSERSVLPAPPAGLFSDVARITAGQKLFAAHCSECHGSIAEGRTQRAARFWPTAPDFQELRYRSALPGYLYRRIEQGRNLEPFRSAGSVMPAWNTHFESGQIWSLVAYLRTRSSPVPTQ